MPPNRSNDFSPGKLYGGISVPREASEGAERKLERRVSRPFVQFCKNTYRSSKSLAGKNPSFKPAFQDAINFLEWDLSAAEFNATVSYVLIVSLIACLAIASILFFFFGSVVESIFHFGDSLALNMFIPAVLIPMGIMYYFQQTPLREARVEQVKALTFVPELMGYMIMSMKLSPNLEKAVEFAAEHGKGKISTDFKDLIWKVQIGVHNTVSEGLDELAWRWGKFSEEFKQGLMRVRASVLEDSEAKRFALLDKTLEQILESIKNKMEQYARDLNQPSITLFYIGVLLPLILIIILPVGSAFSGAALAKPEILILLYNIVIPLLAFYFARQIISKRPPTYEVPQVPDNHPGLPPKGTALIGKTRVNLFALAFLVLIVGLGTSWYVHLNGVIVPFPNYSNDKLEFDSIAVLKPDNTISSVLIRDNKDERYFDDRGTLYQQQISGGASEEKAAGEVSRQKVAFLLQPENDIAPYNLVFLGIVTIGLAAYCWLYYSNAPKRKIQEETMQMESEFQESLYILASRLGENKPIEDAMRHTQEFLPTYRVSKELYAKTIENITLLGMPLEKAVFDEEYGSLKNNPSSLIRSSMRLVIDSVQLGVNVAARTTMSLSLQLGNAEKVSKTLKSLIADVNGTMRMMSMFIAPAILGVTTALQKVVMITLGSIVQNSAVTSISASPTDVTGFGSFSSSVSSSFISADVFNQLVDPTGFLLIVVVYVIEIVVILTYFTTKLEEDNNTLVKINVARAVPIALTVFFISSIATNTIIAGLLGPA